MGGSVFKIGIVSLDTPRMPLDVYSFEKERCKKALRTLYESVACPIDGPEKLDFGDIDICVARPFSNKGDPQRAIKSALGAELVRSNGSITHYAVPWPSHLVPDTDPAGAQRYIQVDVTICSTLEEMQWILFKHAHGDLWSILGSIIRPYGLTIDETCLSVRIPEIEPHNRKLARVALTKEPSQVLSFLGLPEGRVWEVPFHSREEMFRYLTQSPMFYVFPARTRRSIDESPGLEQPALNSKDRKRLNTRPAYREWAEEFLPRCSREGTFSEKRTSREEVLQQAFARFQVQDEYNRRLKAHHLEEQVAHIKRHVIRSVLPAPEGPPEDKRQVLYRGVLAKALTQIIMENDRSYGIYPEPNRPLKNAKGMFILKNVSEFVQEMHRAIGQRALDRHHEAYRERKKARLETEVEAKGEAKVEPKVKAEVEAKSEPKAEVKVKTEAEAGAEVNVKVESDHN